MWYAIVCLMCKHCQCHVSCMLLFVWWCFDQLLENGCWTWMLKPYCSLENHMNCIWMLLFGLLFGWWWWIPMLSMPCCFGNLKILPEFCMNVYGLYCLSVHECGCIITMFVRELWFLIAVILIGNVECSCLLAVMMITWQWWICCCCFDLAHKIYMFLC